MARASSAHLYTWLVLGLLSFLQAPGRTAADTKFDVLVNPAGFLAAAGHAYTDTFTLGQIQNQAYGYLFPHGLFFLLTDPLPDWIAQRLWWTVVMGVGFSGAYLVARKLGFALWPAWVAGLLYALSPRVLTTLTAISSEAWPVALVPWTVLPLIGATRLTWRDVAAAVVPIALMGAVNATATTMACLPAFVLLLWRGAWKHLGGWLVGAAAVSAWWIGPLLVLGKYSAPFTDFIESSYVTTRWLNLAEIFRGTTSWAPFVDTERTAGYLLVAEPVFVLATVAVAAVGIVGLATWRSPWRGYFVVLLCLGVALMGAAHGPFGQAWLGFLDGPGAPFRNLHKLDPLVRLPLVMGVAAVLARVKLPKAVAVGLAAVIAVAPAWSLRLAPTGTWKEVSPDWLAAAEYLDNNVAGTRTLVVPETSFARQTWGWTRDEPIQALTHVPFAVRDAVPLVDPEAIRGLDGQVTALSPEALRAIGVGAVVVRKDLDPEQYPEATVGFGEPTVRYGDIDIHVLDPTRGMMIAPANAMTTVNGGGEVLPLLDKEFGYQPRVLTDQEQADIITDTPALVKRNYGTLQGPVSAHLPPEPASPLEGGNVRNKEVDYPSAGQRVGVRETGGTVSASSSAADAGSFGGAIPAQSLTAAVDGLEDTFWHPAPGDTDPWLEVAAPGPISITATEDTKLTVTSADGEEELSLTANTPVTVTGPATLFPHDPVGLSLDASIRRIVEVPGTGDTYFFQRLLPETDVLQRAFTTAADSQWELSEPALIDGTPHPPGLLTLPAGRHELVSDAKTVSLTRVPAPTGTWAPFTGTVHASDEEQIILTTRAFNDGLRGTIGDTPLEAVTVDSGMQGFRVPAGVHGEFTMSFAGSGFYRASLLGGGALSAIALLFCVLASLRRPRPTETAPTELPSLTTAATLVAAGVCAGALGLVVWAAAMAIKRFTLIPTWLLGGGSAVVMGLWLARAPWPAGNYAGDSLAIALAGCVVLASLAGSSGKQAFPPARN